MNDAFIEFLIGSEEWHFLLEILLRCIIGFITVIVGLKITGKRGIRQLSVFELVIILTLGSAAGDIAFYKDVGVLHAIVTILCFVVLYRLITFFLLKSRKLTAFLEGSPLTIIKDGIYTLEIRSYKDLSFDEFYMELREQGIEHLGQIRIAILEVNGEVSIFKNEGVEVIPGLCVLPEHANKVYQQIPEDGLYACIDCGNTESLQAGAQPQCRHCGRAEWGATSDRGVIKADDKDQSL